MVQIQVSILSEISIAALCLLISRAKPLSGCIVFTVWARGGFETAARLMVTTTSLGRKRVLFGCSKVIFPALRQCLGIAGKIHVQEGAWCHMTKRSRGVQI